MKKITLLLMLFAFTFGFSQEILKTDYPLYDGVFAGTVYTEQTFNFPSGSEGYAGFANNNTDAYPFAFENGGSITFTATTSAPTDLRFAFEYDVYPNVTPRFDVTASLSTGTSTYTVDIPAQPGNVFNSALFYVVENDVTVSVDQFIIETFDSNGDVLKTDYPIYDGVFAGTVYTEQTFNFPSGSEGYAGFANNNTDAYPFAFENGGSITFTATTSAPTDLRFAFEYDVYPNVTPRFDVTASLSTGTSTYTVDIPAQPGNVFNSALFYVVENDVAVSIDQFKINTYATEDGSNAYLSLIELDGTSLSGFNSSVTNYIYLNPLTATTVPVVTATSIDPNADVSIAQATELDGEATIVVTSANGQNTQTYTINLTNLTAATDPPNRDPSDVTSLYSDAYTNSTNWGSIELFGGTLTDVVIDGNNTYEMTSGFQYNYYTPPGTFEDLSDMTHMHVDFYVAGDFVDGSVLGIQLLGLEANQGGSGENTFTQTAFQSYSWVSVDVPFADFNNAASASPLYEDIKLIQVNLQAPAGATFPTVYLDNFYFYREASAGLDDNVFNTVKMFPNPAKDTVQFSVNSNENLDIEIFDMLGKSVLRVNAVRNEVNIADLNSGLYFVQMTLGTQQATKKLVVN